MGHGEGIIYHEGGEGPVRVSQKSSGCPIFQGIVELLDPSSAKRWKEIGSIKKKMFRAAITQGNVL